MFVPNPWSVKCLDVSTASIIFNKNLAETTREEEAKEVCYSSWLVKSITSSAVKVTASAWLTIGSFGANSSRGEQDIAAWSLAFHPSWGGSGDSSVVSRAVGSVLFCFVFLGASSGEAKLAADEVCCNVKPVNVCWVSAIIIKSTGAEMCKGKIFKLRLAWTYKR